MRKVMAMLVTPAILAALSATALPAVALAAPPPPIQVPTQMTDYPLWPQWARTYLADAVEYQIMQGYPDGSMRPHGNITRAEFTAMLARAMGNAEPDPTQSTRVFFSDVAGTDWFYPAVQVLTSAGVLLPGSGRFNPNQPVTRYDAAVWLGRALGEFGVKGQSKAPAFPDVSSSSPAYPDFTRAYRMAVIIGYPDGTFDPSGAITRAEAAAMITRFLANLPGYAQLSMQTPYLGELETTPHNWHVMADTEPTVPLVTASNLGFTPAATKAQFDTETYATWGQVHLWLATWNWLAIGEAKLSRREASYIVNYGLEPWEVAEIGAVGGSYMGILADSPVLVDLGKGQEGLNYVYGTFNGQFAPVSSVFLQDPDNPWIQGAGGWAGGPEITLISVTTAGIFPQWIAVRQPNDISGYSPNDLWGIYGVQNLTEQFNLSKGHLVVIGG